MGVTGLTACLVDTVSTSVRPSDDRRWIFLRARCVFLIHESVSQWSWEWLIRNIHIMSAMEEHTCEFLLDWLSLSAYRYNTSFICFSCSPGDGSLYYYLYTKLLEMCIYRNKNKERKVGWLICSFCMHVLKCVMCAVGFHDYYQDLCTHIISCLPHQNHGMSHLYDTMRLSGT